MIFPPGTRRAGFSAMILLVKFVFLGQFQNCWAPITLSLWESWHGVSRD